MASLSGLSGQIRHLLNSLNDSNSDSLFQELSLYAQQGTDESIVILRSCLDRMDINRRDLNNVQLEPLYGLVFKYLLDSPDFSTVLSESLSSLAIDVEFLANLSNALHLALPEKVGLGLALLDSENSDIRMCGKNYCMTQIGELCASHVSVDSANQIYSILMFLQRSEGLAKHLDSFMQMLSPVDHYILAPLISDELREEYFLGNVLAEGYEGDFDYFGEEMEKEMSMADIIKEMGYGCTINVTQCKEMLSRFSPLTELVIARILGTIARTHTGLEENPNAYSAVCVALGNGNLTDMPSLNSWNIDVLVESINQLAPGIKWIHVFENLDHGGFYLPSKDAFYYFMSIFRHACQDPFPLHSICGSVWKNSEGQISFLKYAVCVPPEVFTFSHSGRQLKYADGVHGHSSQPGYANHAWRCLDLLEVLCQLAEQGHANAVRSMLKQPIELCPEVLLLGMAHINTTYNLLRLEVCSSVFPNMLKSISMSGVILKLWHVDPTILLWGLVDAYDNDPDNLAYLARVLDVCQELKILFPILDMVPSYFGIRLAAVGSQRVLLDLEKWLSSKLSVHKDTFFEECLKFLKDIQFGVSRNISSDGSIWKYYADTTPTLVKALQAHAGLINSSQLLEEMGKLLATYMPASSAMESGGTNDASPSDGYADDIEEEANSYFQKMFSGELTIDVIIQMLARFKESSDQRERSLFECMIGNVFEEYKYIPKYPEMQLKIAALLFGSLIKHQLVTHLTLGIALRGVVDALRRQADTKMFVFGTIALEQFVDRLIEWPQCCNHILLISHLRTTHPELIAFIERELAKISSSHSESDGRSASAAQQPSFIQADSTNMEMPSSSTFPLIGSVSKPIGMQASNSVRSDESQTLTINSSSYMKPPASPAGVPSLGPSSDMSAAHKSQSATSHSAALSSSTGFTRPSRSTTSARFGSALNIETLVAAAEKRESPLEAPASEIQDKISFVINNLSVSNFEAKAKDFAEILKEPYYPWFAQYMVMKRASIEPNFHDLYLKFLDKVSSKPLNKEIVKVTYENCKVLLGSDLIKSSSEERSLLKNLGSWLGKITIGRNQVLRAREIDLKSLIIEAYEKGLMIAVIPFTSKVLEPCQSSVAYRPPNPYTMGILGLLTEIYTMPNLKMNLKFEIEVLFKNLGVDMKDVTPTSLLKDRVRQIEGNPDFSNKDVSVSQQHLTGDVKSGTISTLNQVDLPLEVASPSHPAGHSNILSQYSAPVHLSSGALTEDEKYSALGLSDQLPSAQGLLQRPPPFSVSQLSTTASGIDQQVVVNPKLHSLGLYMHFQSVVPIAMERAIKDTVTGIVTRSVSIATQTTKELVLKDYAMEMDETRIRNAAHLMVASLAGSLAHVTCKEPLRGSISSQLRNSLQGLNNTIELLEQAVQLVTNDNLDLGCALIEQSATEKAIQAIDGDIAQHLSLRRKQREGVGSAYFDSGIYNQGHMGFLPEALRPKPGRLSHSQQRVYEDFVRLPWQNQSGHASHALPTDASASSVGTGMIQAFSSASGLLNSGSYSSGIGSTGVSAMPQPSDLVSEDAKSSPTQLNSASSSQVVIADESSIDFENDVSGSFSSTSAPESHSIETSSVKGLAASSQSLPSTAATERVTSEPLLTTGDALEKYQIFSEKLEALVMNDATDVDIQGLVAEVPGIILRCISRDEAALAVAQKVFKGLYENASKSALKAAHLAILAAIRDVSKLVVKELTSWVIYSDEDRKFNKEIAVGLIRSELLNLAEYNVHMAKLLDGGRNKAATEFAISLIQTLLINDSKVISELHNLVDALAKLAARPGTPESLQQLVEVARNPSANAVTTSPVSFGKEDIDRQAKEEKASSYSTAITEDNNVLEMVESDPAGFRDQVSGLFAEWYRICELPGVNDGACAHYVLQLQQSGLLKGDDASDRFFRCLTEIAVSHCLSSEVVNTGPLQSAQQANPLSFLGIDIYAKLVFAILKFFPADQGSSKVSLLPKVLAVTVRFIQRDAEEKKSSFNPRPYFRLFINWLLDLGSMEPVYDGANFHVLSAFANAFHSLQPLKVPGFSFGWLELVSHKSFMPKLLTGNSQKGWPYMQRLLVDLFQFLEPFLRNAELGVPVHFLYRGTLRVLLVLLHDFPEFLCDYHFSFCDVIPPSCIQMRNIILSAFPRNMRLPDPSTPNLKIDLLAEITQSPRILSEVDGALKAKQIKGDVDEYLKNRTQGSSFLTDLKQKLLLPQSDAGRNGTRYNVPLINSLVLYVGVQAIQQLQAKSSHAQSMASNVPLAMYFVGAALDIFQTLIIDLDTEGRYLFLNAIANQLRYPNNHTHYFSFVLLYLFAELNQEIIQEQITRVLLERLIVNRPHPWGLLITFIELIKNPRYNFWSRSFTRCAPEIEKLFESVSRSCGGPKPVDEGVVSGGLSDNLH